MTDLDGLTILGLAFGLALDAFAVSVATGLILRERKVYHAVRCGTSFGIFQTVMPLIGWGSGLFLQKYIAAFDHWVAFVLLVVIGGKMIWEAFRIEEAEKTEGSLTFKVLLLLSIATSIDALAVGVSLACINVAIVVPVIIIGVVTFALSFCGVFIGNKLGHLFEKNIEIAGGLVLIGIGCKIVFEHMR